MNPDYPPAMPEYAVLPGYVDSSKAGKLFLKIIMAHQNGGKGKKIKPEGKPVGNVGARHGGGRTSKGGKK